MTISTPHWWAPIRAKQLSVALLSFLGWLGRRSLVAAYRVSCPPGQSFSFTDLVRWRNIQWFHLSQIPHTGQCVHIPICPVLILHTQAATSCTFVTIFALSTSLRDHHPKSYISQTVSVVPFMTKEMLYGIGLPLDVPLPHTLWMMPRGWVCCVIACV